MRIEPELPVALRGYDRHQVDELLARVSRALDGGPSLPADEVRGAAFDVVLRGYERRAVERLLSECIKELQAMPDGRPGGAPPGPDRLIGWIQNARFPSSGLRPGYDVRDVDAFLDRVIAGLRGSAPPVTARDVRESRFGTVRLKPGYAEREVDGFMAQLASALES